MPIIVMTMRDRARHQEIAAVELGVEPEPRSNVDRRRGDPPSSAARAAAAQVATTPCGVVLHEARRVRIAAVGDDLDAGLSPRAESAAESRRT